MDSFGSDNPKLYNGADHIKYPCSGTDDMVHFSHLLKKHIQASGGAGQMAAYDRLRQKLVFTAKAQMEGQERLQILPLQAVQVCYESAQGQRHRDYQMPQMPQ